MTHFAELVDVLLWRTWWRYADSPGWFDEVYHWLNLVEGCILISLAALVLLRFVRQRKSLLELIYGFTFLTFGVSDFREAYALESWLVAWKLFNVVALLMLRRIVISRYYPEWKTY